jgi:hypothetical protein
VAAFLAFAEEAFAAFDPVELTVVHRPATSGVAKRPAARAPIRGAAGRGEFR